MARSPKSAKAVDALRHNEASRRNIPTAEMESFFRRDEDSAPMPPLHYPRARPLAEGETRTDEEPSAPELIWNGAKITITDAQMEELATTGRLTLSDAQLVWRGKDRQDWTDLVVNVPPLYIQEKIHPKAIIDDLKRRAAKTREAETDAPDLFADFNGIEPDARAEFYQHDQHWSNRMILGDSLQVMASLAERESLRGKVQCIYFDPPYGIKFNSNWQVSTQSRDVKDGKQADISREPEQVKAFRDTWKDGIHSYLTYLRDRLTAMRDLLTESGSIFVQIGDENVHRVRAVMDEVFGTDNCLATIPFATTGGTTGDFLPATFNYILHYARNKQSAKYRQLYLRKSYGGDGASAYNRFEFIDGRRIGIADARKMGVDEEDLSQGRIFRIDNLKSQSGGRAKGDGAACWVRVPFKGVSFDPGSKATWKTHEGGIERLLKAGRCESSLTNLYYVRYIDDFPAFPLSDQWTDTTTAGFAANKQYVVETSSKVIERCILMATDPGDLVLDPTCGSGTTAFVAEQWGRRWITIDTSRVALALARTRLMAARYQWYLLADSREGRTKEGALTQRPPADTPVHNDIRQGFVYERVPHITLKSIANNPLIDDIWEKWQAVLEPLRVALNTATEESWEEWQIPRELPATAPASAVEPLGKWWEARIARQREIDASIVARADVEYLYDKPYQDNGRVRVAGPFTVESLSPHRVLPASEQELIEEIDAAEGKRIRADIDTPGYDFAAVVIDYLKAEGVKQQAKGDRITFESLTPWPGNFIGASGTFIEGEDGPERRAAILVGPEYGTVGRQDIVAAAREAVDARFDVLIACAFNFDAHSSELGSLGSLRILKARINPDMHMSDELKNTGRGNMFVVFGEPDVEILDAGGTEIRVKVNGVDVFDPNTGDIRSSDTKGIAAWFIDTDYDEESFFVRHAYFLGANDPYKSLKTALQAEIDEEAWATLYSDTSRPFERPAGGRIAVKVINHFGDEVMKVFGV
ncbi:MAG: methylase [Sphingomonas bacterium]|uniref:site-specific DNA-methyltransferase n=1 Tax=Sphingomonas bacterium TaxID=1895847 RepID=UPI0026360C8F|nr:site-specific DNA-methyltransferase [Sphingomonas bacterium]MDB5706413.1 methylase [Sphingomonas bacterium]